MIFLFIAVVGGGICAFVASEKKRNPIAWFFIGFCFPLVGILIIFSLRKDDGITIPDDVSTMMAAPPTGSSKHLEELQRVADLRDRGVLSEAEFLDQKHEIMSRS